MLHQFPRFRRERHAQVLRVVKLLPVPLGDERTDAVAQLVGYERLLRLRQAEFPRHAGVLDRGKRRGPGAAVMAGDLDDIGVGLGHTGRHRADADLCDELHRHGIVVRGQS